MGMRQSCVDQVVATVMWAATFLQVRGNKVHATLSRRHLVVRSIDWVAGQGGDVPQVQRHRHHGQHAHAGGELARSWRLCVDR